MRGFPLLFIDELKGFYKSYVMIFLLIFVPLIAILIYAFAPISIYEKMFFTSIIVSSLGGVLSAALLSANIINEMDSKTYDLFLIRPIKRWNILLSKYLAVVICVSIACMLSLAVNIVGYWIEFSALPDTQFFDIINIVILTFSFIAIGSSFGLLTGVAIPSLVGAVIIDIFIGQYLMYIPYFIGQYTDDPTLWTAIFALGLMIGLTSLAILLFNRKDF